MHGKRIAARIVAGILLLTACGGDARPGVDALSIPAPSTTAAPTTTTTTVDAATTITTGPGTTTTVPVTLTRRIPLAGSRSYDLSEPGSPGLRPVLVLLPGSDGSVFDTDDIAAAAAGAGAVVLNLRYRPEPPYVGTVGDVACATAIVRAMKDDLGVDLERVVVAGFSLGGTVVAAYGLSDPPPDPSVDCVSDAGPVPASAIVGIAGAYDLADYLRDDLAGSVVGDGPHGPLTGEEAWGLLSPYAQVGERPAVPVWLVHGGGDGIVEVTVSRAFRDALDGAGNPVTFVEVPLAGHSGIVDPGLYGGEAVAAVLDALGLDPTG